jgi:hypothetical protein
LNGKIRPAPFDIGDWVRLWDERELKPLEPVRSYLFTFGVWQYWDMFSPNPADTDIYGDAVVHFKNGSTKVVQYPRISTLSIPQKYMQERFRKFYERAHDEVSTGYLFNPFIYQMALLAYTDPNNPPVSVDLRRHTHAIPPPGAPENVGYTQNVYFVGEIDPTILNQLKREER